MIRNLIGSENSSNQSAWIISLFYYKRDLKQLTIIEHRCLEQTTEGFSFAVESHNQFLPFALQWTFISTFISGAQSQTSNARNISKGHNGDKVENSVAMVLHTPNGQIGDTTAKK